MTHYDNNNQQQATMNDANELDAMANAMALRLQELNDMGVRLQELAEQRRRVPPPLPTPLPPVPPLVGAGEWRMEGGVSRKIVTLTLVYDGDYDGDYGDKATIRNILIGAVRNDPVFNSLVSNYTQATIRNKIHTNDYEALAANSEYGKVTGHFTVSFLSFKTQEKTKFFHINLIDKGTDKPFWTYAGFSVRGMNKTQEQMLNIFIE